MANLLYVFRYFRIVPPIPPLMTGCFSVLVAAGAWITAFTGDQDGAAVVPILVLQAFSASTGFAAPARRGYFDLLIARGEPRVRIAAVQWLTAIAPGLASWAAVAVVHVVAHGAAANPLLTTGTATAFLMASTIPWAVTVGLPRFSGAIGWLLLVCVESVGGVVWPDPVHDILFPVDVVGQDVVRRPAVLVPALALAAIATAAALVWVHRTDIPLEAAQ